MKIYLITTAGYPNYGDELLLKAWLDEIEKRYPEADVWVDSHSPGVVQGIFNGIFPRVKYVDLVWRMAWSCPSDSQHEAINYGLSAWTIHRKKWIRFESSTSVFLNADIIHIIGAGFINNIWPKHLSIPGIVRSAPFRKKDRKLVISGAGLMPLDNNVAPSLSLILSGFNHVDLRDSESYQLMRETGFFDDEAISLTGDDAFLIEITTIENENSTPEISEKCRLALCLQGDFWEGDDPHESIKILAEEIKRVFTDDIKILYYEFIPGVDDRYLSIFENYFKNIEFIDFQRIMRNGLELKNDDFVISSRFHMHLLAARKGASGVWLNFRSGYYDVKHRSVVASGSNWDQYSIGNKLDKITVELPDSELMKEVRFKKLNLVDKIYGALN